VAEDQQSYGGGAVAAPQATPEKPASHRKASNLAVTAAAAAAAAKRKAGPYKVGWDGELATKADDGQGIRDEAPALTLSEPHADMDRHGSSINSQLLASTYGKGKVQNGATQWHGVEERSHDASSYVWASMNEAACGGERLVRSLYGGKDPYSRCDETTATRSQQQVAFHGLKEDEELYQHISRSSGT
jgi:hypothetical protein